MTAFTTAVPPAPARTPSASILNWYVEGVRAALFLRPRWKRVTAGPAALALLAVLGSLLYILLQRLDMGDGAVFNWRAVGEGWLHTALLAWACFLVRPDGRADPDSRAAPGAAHLMCAAFALTQIFVLAISLLLQTADRTGLYDLEVSGVSGVWAGWMLLMLWSVAAEIVMVVRGGAQRPGAKLLAAIVLLASSALALWLPPPYFWYDPDAGAETARPQLRLTQQLMEAQPALLDARLNALASQRPGVVDVYSITFAPYADEDVFRNESAMVSEVMAERFDARDRQIQLVNHIDTVDRWPWATPLNLQRAIAAVAARMDPQEDILFLHMTSHGARDGQLAAGFWPLEIDSVTPGDLKAWLDDAGVRYRVLSISACYSGSWIAPLADDDTLVMTAADAEHTSYGCGRGSELTFFGRAMYDEQLRTHTRSFEQAHAAAREVIRQREEEAGKSDGYSNPQILFGAGLRPRLDALLRRLEP